MKNQDNMFNFIKYFTKFLILCIFVCVLFSFSVIYYQKPVVKNVKNVKIIQLLKEQINAVKDFKNADFKNIFKLWIRNSLVLLIAVYALKYIRDELQLDKAQNICSYQRTLRIIIIEIPIVLGFLIGFHNIRLYHVIGNSYVNTLCVALSMIFFHAIFELIAYILFCYKCFYKTYQKSLYFNSPQELLSYINNSWGELFTTMGYGFILLAIAAYIEIQGFSAAWIYINHL